MKRYRVGIPTTGGMCWVQSIEQIDVLPASHVVEPGDFRHVFPSQDYATLTKTLLPKLGIDGLFELVIAGEIESGRSWELPVLLAHVLQDKGLLAQADDDTAAIVIATGAVSQDLTLVEDDYSLDQKAGHLPDESEAVLSAPSSRPYSSFTQMPSLQDALVFLGLELASIKRQKGTLGSTAKGRMWGWFGACFALVVALPMSFLLFSRQNVDEFVSHKAVHADSLDACAEWFRENLVGSEGEMLCGWEIWRTDSDTDVFLTAAPGLTDQIYDLSRQVLNQTPLLPLSPHSLKIGTRSQEGVSPVFRVRKHMQNQTVFELSLENAE